MMGFSSITCSPKYIYSVAYLFQCGINGFVCSMALIHQNYLFLLKSSRAGLWDFSSSLLFF